jgi:hypothetical protein
MATWLAVHGDMYLCKPYISPMSIYVYAQVHACMYKQIRTYSTDLRTLFLHVNS